MPRFSCALAGAVAMIAELFDLSEDSRGKVGPYPPVARLISTGSEFEARSRAAAIGFAGRQQAYDSAQSLPGRLVQGGVGADQVADHLPRRNVERALGRRSHRQGDRALRTEADPLRRRFLARPDAHGLGEHVYRDRFLSGLELPIAAKTKQVFQRSSRAGCQVGPRKYCLQRKPGASTEEDSRELGSSCQEPEPSCALARSEPHRALYRYECRGSLAQRQATRSQVLSAAATSQTAGM